MEEDAAALALAPADAGGTPVYNFALARVRYRDVQVANNVRVFFRMWPAQQTNATYDSSTTYRSFTSGTQKIPLLGISGDEIMTIPFFAAPRVPTNAALTTQTDAPNVRNVNFDPSGRRGRRLLRMLARHQSARRPDLPAADGRAAIQRIFRTARSRRSVRWSRSNS